MRTMGTYISSSKKLSIVVLLLGILIILMTLLPNTVRRGELLMEFKETPKYKLMEVVFISYVRGYSLKEAYEEADLVILGEIVYVEHHVFSIERLCRGRILTLTRPYTYYRIRIIKIFKGEPISSIREEPTSDIIIVGHMGGTVEGILLIVPEDPPMKEGEFVILFLRGPIEKGDYVKYPRIEYRHMGVFGRFKVVDGEIYSAMYSLPEEIGGIPCRSRAESILKQFEGYDKVNGITVKEFLKLVRD